MTPSGWHDSARHRDAGHDELQSDVYHDLLEWGMSEMVIQDRRYERTLVEVEFPFIQDCTILGFGDVCEKYTEVNPRGSPGIYLRAYEIKPKIDSVGALIRQIKATKNVIGRISFKEGISSYGVKPTFNVVPVFPENDPKAVLFGGVYKGPIWRTPANFRQRAIDIEAWAKTQVPTLSV